MKTKQEILKIFKSEFAWHRVRVKASGSGFDIQCDEADAYPYAPESVTFENLLSLSKKLETKFINLKSVKRENARCSSGTCEGTVVNDISFHVWWSA